MDRRPTDRTFLGQIVIIILGGVGGIAGAAVGLVGSLYVYGACCAFFMGEIQQADPGGGRGVAPLHFLAGLDRRGKIFGHHAEADVVGGLPGSKGEEKRASRQRAFCRRDWRAVRNRRGGLHGRVP